MGAYHTALQQYDSSRFYYLAYIKDRQERKRLSWRRHVGTLVNIAESYLQQNQPEPALQYLQQAITILESPQIKPYAAYYLHFSNLMVGKALLLQKQYAKSRQVTEYALLQMPATGQRLRMEIADAYNTVAMACEALGDVPAALHYKNLYVQLHDSLLKKEQLDRINALEVRYRLAEKERVLAESQLKITQTTQQVRTRNLAIALFASIMALGLALLILWRRRQIHQQRLQNAQVEAIQKNLEIERLKAGMEGEEMERSRIARDLHDGIGGLLSAAKMNLELVNQKMGPQAPQDLREGITLVQEAASELRKTAHNLMPQILLTDGLAKAIEGYAKRLIGQRSIAFTMQVLGNPIALPPDMEFSLLRTLQELVHNIVKHAKATEALVQINYSNGQVLDITVEDNGGGFDLNAQKQGMGLQNIQQRVSLLGGHLDVQSSFGRGTSIYLEFALYAHNLHAATQ
ncbi:MAG TPA: sensor histidine kinase, partial [Phnomibacter sp.]|nr:sensor histidine kinase [Phnomibacter sp.]